MLIAAAAATALFVCGSPTIHDGDNIRCEGMRTQGRLYSIDAPEMPGACRPGRRCTPGDPIASRDNLRQLVGGQLVRCRAIDADRRTPEFDPTDAYGRPILQCFVGKVDLSCAQIAAGHAVRRYGSLRCGTN